jgi:hypothetical protein
VTLWPASCGCRRGYTTVPVRVRPPYRTVDLPRKGFILRSIVRSSVRSLHVRDASGMNDVAAEYSRTARAESETSVGHTATQFKPRSFGCCKQTEPLRVTFPITPSERVRQRLGRSAGAAVRRSAQLKCRQICSPNQTHATTADPLSFATGHTCRTWPHRGAQHRTADADSAVLCCATTVCVCAASLSSSASRCRGCSSTRGAVGRCSCGARPRRCTKQSANQSPSYA